MKEKYRDRAHGIEFSSQYQNPQQILKGLPNSQNVTSLSSSDISNKPHQNHVASPQSPYETDPRLSQVSHSVHTHIIRVIPLGSGILDCHTSVILYTHKIRVIPLG